MMFKRDLSVELKQEEEASIVATSSKAPRLMPPQPKGPPNKQPMSIEVIRDQVSHAYHCELDSVICVKAQDELCNELILNKDESACHELTSLCGNFFDTGSRMHSSRIWKTCYAADGEAHYYMFANIESHKGKAFHSWYVSDMLWSCAEEKAAANKLDPPPVILAWGTGAHYMVQVHFPFWASKKCPQISVCSLWDYALKTSQQLDEVLAHYNAPPVEPENDDIVDVEQEDWGKGKGKGKGYAGGKGKQHEGPHRGGWLPKMAKLCMAVMEQNYGRANQLVNQYCESSHTLASIVAKRNGASSSSSHGGWW